MQYTTHYNLNLPEGTDIVNPLIQDNPNYSAIDTALYDNKLRVIGNATHTKTGTNHAITLADSDIVAFKFVATGDYVTGDTFTVDGVTVTARVADGSTIPSGAFKINSIVFAILNGSILNLININGSVAPEYVQVVGDGVKTHRELLNDLFALIDPSKITGNSYVQFEGTKFAHLSETPTGSYVFTWSSARFNYDIDLGIHINNTASRVLEWDNNTSGNNVNEATLQIPTAGYTYRLYY